MGDTETARPLLDQKKKQYKVNVKYGVRYVRYSVPLDIEAMTIALLDDDIEKAIQYLQAAMKNGYLPDNDYRNHPFFKS